MEAEELDIRAIRGATAVATWRFGEQAVSAGRKVLACGGSALDAVEKGINAVELDPSVTTVGYGGLPNSCGVVELDAAVMWGPGRQVGAVAGLRGIAEAVSVARAVMERTNHCMLAGEGARSFALAQGFRARRLLTRSSRQKWEEWQSKGGRYEPDSHDTVGMVAVDCEGNVCAGTSTSGLAFKMPGRVGDSPLVGSGLYADNSVGGAVATGVGERILRYCMCLRVVELMSAGHHPQDACQKVVRFMVQDDESNLDGQAAVLAMDRMGRVGAASTRPGFCFAVSLPEGVRIVAAPDYTATGRA
ncbi:MAG: N(4)-(beta-N-acetylglucosaminyl)-L-asparaginase [Armatimonadota bacterium]